MPTTLLRYPPPEALVPADEPSLGHPRASREVHGVEPEAHLGLLARYLGAHFLVRSHGDALVPVPGLVTVDVVGTLAI